MSPPVKVLLLAANPDDNSAGLRIDHEIRRALEAVRMGSAGDRLKIEPELAAGAENLPDALQRHHPQIVHFAGHGYEKGIELDDGSIVRASTLAGLFTTFREVRVVVLNACETLPVAKRISQVVDYTVAMELPIHDSAAIRFSGAFYAALAFGRTVRSAFEEAAASLKAKYGERHAIPHLLVRPGADETPLAPSETSADFIEQKHNLRKIDAVGNVETEAEAPATAATRTSQHTCMEDVKSGGDVRSIQRVR